MKAKEIREYADLYGYAISVELMKKMGYKTVSIANDSIPSMGSPCNKIDMLDTELAHVEIEKVICHKNDSITMLLKMPYCNLRFWK